MDEIKIHKNRGLDLEKEKADRSPEDWVFGVGEELKGIAEDVALIDYLPKGEIQRSDKEDMMDCASRGPNNLIETKLNYWLRSGNMSWDNIEWLYDNGYIVFKNML